MLHALVSDLINFCPRHRPYGCFCRLSPVIRLNFARYQALILRPAQRRTILLLSISMMVCDAPWHSLMLNSVAGASTSTKKREKPSPAGSDHQTMCARSEMATEYLPSDRLVTTGRLPSSEVRLRRFIRPLHRRRSSCSGARSCATRTSIRIQ